MLALSALSFDLSVWDLFGTLAAGGTVVMPEAWATREPGRWADLLAATGVTVWNSVQRYRIYERALGKAPLDKSVE